MDIVPLHRSPAGVIWANEDDVFICGTRYSREKFRTRDQLDYVVLTTLYDIDIYVGALAREAIHRQGITVRASSGEPRSCMCDSRLERVEQHPTLEKLVTYLDSRNLADMRANPYDEDGRVIAVCTVCRQPWMFTWKGVPETRWYAAAEWHLAMPFGKKEADVIGEALRAGGEINVGSGRCFYIYRGTNDGFVCEAWDDGTSETSACSEESLRDVIGREFPSFLPFVQRPFAEKLRAAVLEGRDAIGHLGDLVTYRHTVHHADELAALLEWPEKKPAMDLRLKIASELTGNGVYHALLSAIGYGPNTAAVGRAGLRLLDALVGIRGNEEIPDLEDYRKTFREMNAAEPAPPTPPAEPVPDDFDPAR